MMTAYEECYLNDAMNNLGEAFEYVANACNFKLCDFLQHFINTGFANEFGRGNPKFVSGLSGTELAMTTLSASNQITTFPHPQIDFSYSTEFWCGWILAYFQWKSNLSFSRILKNISIDEILKLYGVLHETSEEKCFDTIYKIILNKNKISKLQQQRKICAYSQSELAIKSGINLRTLQQYEIKTKNINKASVETVSSLAKVLYCNIDDILEYENQK